jgi:hypothetical protein
MIRHNEQETLLNIISLKICINLHCIVSTLSSFLNFEVDTQNLIMFAICEDLT